MASGLDNQRRTAPNDEQVRQVLGATRRPVALAAEARHDQQPVHRRTAGRATSRDAYASTNVGDETDTSPYRDESEQDYVSTGRLHPQHDDADRLPQREQAVAPMRRAWHVLLMLGGCGRWRRPMTGTGLWLRYDRIADDAVRGAYAGAISEIVVSDASHPTVAAARDELTTGLRGLLGTDIPVVARAGRRQRPGARNVTRVLGDVGRQPRPTCEAAGDEGFVLRRVARDGGHRTVIVANRDVGLLYGAFALLRHLQTQRPLDGLDVVSAPRVERRLLNHWDNLDRTVERGYAGFSIWEWFYLPEIREPALPRLRPRVRVGRHQRRRDRPTSTRTPRS